jgi:hypothetical protein
MLLPWHTHAHHQQIRANMIYPTNYRRGVCFDIEEPVVRLERQPRKACRYSVAGCLVCSVCGTDVRNPSPRLFGSLEQRPDPVDVGRPMLAASRYSKEATQCDHADAIDEPEVSGAIEGAHSLVGLVQGNAVKVVVRDNRATAGLDERQRTVSQLIHGEEVDFCVEESVS